MISTEEWDTRYWVIFNDLVWEQDHREDDECKALAELECTEQFGVRPEEQG